MKVKELYNMAIKAVADGLEDYDVVVSEISVEVDEEDINESFTVVLDKPVVMLHIAEDSKEFRIFEISNSSEDLDAYEEAYIND